MVSTASNLLINSIIFCLITADFLLFRSPPLFSFIIFPLPSLLTRISNLPLVKPIDVIKNLLHTALGWLFLVRKKVADLCLGLFFWGTVLLWRRRTGSYTEMNLDKCVRPVPLWTGFCTMLYDFSICPDFVAMKFTLFAMITGLHKCQCTLHMGHSLSNPYNKNTNRISRVRLCPQ